MKPHTYTFKFVDPTETDYHQREGSVEANGKEAAYKAAMADTRLKGCKILKSSFRRTDTAKGPNRAGGLDSNGKQINARTIRDDEYENIHMAIDAISESVRINGCESPLTDFLINYLTANVDDIKDAMMDSFESE